MNNKEIKPILPISVVIPTAGRENLGPAIESILSQSALPQELLICADGPVVNVDRLKSEFEHMFSSSKIFFSVSTHKSGGPAEPRNRGIELSTQPYVAFLDDDDTWLPNKLETQYLNIQASRVVACGTNAFVIWKGEVQGKYFSHSGSNVRLLDLVRRNSLITSSMICKKSSLIEAGGFDTNPEYAGIEDYLLWIRLAALGKIITLEDCLVNYTKVSSQSLSSRVNKGTLHPVESARKEFISWGIRRPQSFLKAIGIWAYNFAASVFKMLKTSN